MYAMFKKLSYLMGYKNFLYIEMYGMFVYLNLDRIGIGAHHELIR